MPAGVLLNIGVLPAPQPLAELLGQYLDRIAINGFIHGGHPDHGNKPGIRDRISFSPLRARR